MGLHLKEGADDLAENHEINVTPFIDVMLVLLIIFMVTMPIQSVPVDVDLPQKSVVPPDNQKDPPEPIKLRIDASETWAL